MNIVKPYAHIITNLIADKVLVSIESAARVSHRSEDKMTDTSWERFIRAVVIDKGDWSVVEHVSASVEFLVDRGITHELVRHRLFSYTQESTRFVNYEKKMPPSFIRPELKNRDSELIWELAIKYAEIGYRKLLANGETPQIARSVFPNALASKIIMTGNLRSWRHFLIMRTTKETHPQMKEVTIPLLKEFQEKVPLLYDDIIPEEKQSIALSKPK